jgi:hypothetical protein
VTTTRRYPTRTRKELAAIRVAYVEGTLGVKEIFRQFNCRQAEFYLLVERHGWPKRGQTSAVKTLNGKLSQSRRKRRTNRQIIDDAREATARRRIELYGDAATDVEFLLTRDFVVVRSGYGFLIDGKPKTFDELRAVAARERRLMGAINVTR